MKTEREQCKEILERFCADRKFETTDRTEVYSIYILQRKGCVVADLTIDSDKNVYNAVIKEITLQGKKEFLDKASKTGADAGLPLVERQKLAIQVQLDNDKARDSVLLHLASGGIALAFGLMTFKCTISKTQFVVWAIAVGIWILSLLSLLTSFTTSRIMYDNDPSLVTTEQALKKRAIAEFANVWMNRFATLLFVLGLIVFTIFVVIQAKGVMK